MEGGQPFLIRPEPRFKRIILRRHGERIGSFFTHERLACIPSVEEIPLFRGRADLDILPAIAFPRNKARFPFAFIFACKGELVEHCGPFGGQNEVSRPSAFDGRDVFLTVVPTREFVALPRWLRQRESGFDVVGGGVSLSVAAPFAEVIRNCIVHHFPFGVEGDVPMGSNGKRSNFFGKRRIKIPAKEGIALLARG